MQKRTILITASDMSRLRRLLESALHFFRHDRPYLEVLQNELETARVVESKDIPEDVVTLNSRVCIRDLDTGKQVVSTVVFPKESYMNNELLSVLAPVGTAVLGRRVGDIFECTVPAGVRRLKLEGIETETRAQSVGKAA